MILNNCLTCKHSFKDVNSTIWWCNFPTFGGLIGTKPEKYCCEDILMDIVDHHESRESDEFIKEGEMIL